jgi:thiamine-phosphate pyrophosphorylase
MSIVFPPLYAILDAGSLKTPKRPVSAELTFSQEMDLAQELAESGVELLQYRNKLATARQLFDDSLALSKRLASLVATTRVRFILNDRPDIALLSGAGGVHVGQLDLDVEDARSLVGPDLFIGVSTHTLDQVTIADQTSADYIAFGPIFATPTKDRHDPVVGIAGLAVARAHTRKPLVAIGGITLENAAEIYDAGADSLAVARDLSLADRPGARARAYLDIAHTALNKRAAPGPAGNRPARPPSGPPKV